MLTNKSLKISTIVKNTTPDLINRFLTTHNALPETEADQPASTDDIISFTESRVTNDWALMNDFMLIEGYASGHLPIEELHSFLEARHRQQPGSFNLTATPPYDQIITTLLHAPESVRSHFHLNYYRLNYGNSSRLDRRDYADPAITAAITPYNIGQLKESLRPVFKEFLERSNPNNDIISLDCEIIKNTLSIAVTGIDNPQTAETVQNGSIACTTITPPLYMAFAISTQNSLVEVYAKGAGLKRELHREIAKVIFNRENLPDFASHNEVYDTQTIFESLMQHGEMNVSLPAPFISLAPREIVCVRMRPPFNAHTFRVREIDSKDCGKALNKELRDFLRVDQKSGNTVLPSYLKARKITFTAFYHDANGHIKELDFHLKSNGETDLKRSDLHQSLRDTLIDSNFIRNENSKYQETVPELIAKLLKSLPDDSGRYCFSSDVFRYLTQSAISKLTGTGWIAFDKLCRIRECGQCGHRETSEEFFACSGCGAVGVYVLPLSYSIAPLEIATACMQAFDLPGAPTSVIANHFYGLGFSDHAGKNVFLCFSPDDMLSPDCVDFVKKQGEESIVLHTSDTLTAPDETKGIQFLRLMDRLKWTDKNGFCGMLPKARASNVSQKKGGQARADKYQAIKEWCRNKFNELRITHPKEKTKKTDLCRMVAQAAINAGKWERIENESEADAVERLYENLYTKGWLKGLK